MLFAYEIVMPSSDDAMQSVVFLGKLKSGLIYLCELSTDGGCVSGDQSV